ncbi:PREDICTED: E3 ubiquitin-protein ligase HERC2-like [Amphimedon queenslandica]|uniref:Uncharacterized protein n=1 Tax=Amphimedon queenslandica TaxID=400682 RepID=A0AAN0J401_AMPQE|nr:PREDICTED: E3 ubiquitin-protein ligase HERC2-like [Amphimedon queenslandica]|eukprot:XP_019851476.1 PREDICTED: E3 ubiquitin-protein ligase HERC2-like [Amphimedon queenslandica]
MLRSSTKYDSKWIKTNLQLIFSDEDLNRMWSEMVTDGEIMTDQSYPNDSDNGDTEPGGSAGSDKAKSDSESEQNETVDKENKKSEFKPILEEWTWGEEPTLEQLVEAQRVVISEQEDLNNEVALTSLSINRLNKRVRVMERVFTALSNRNSVTVQDDKEVVPMAVSSVKQESKAPATSSKNNQGTGTEGLARLGAKTALSFAFAFLRRAWRSGEDKDLCSEVLQQALDILYEVPVPSLFNSSDISNVWLETVDQCMSFLKSVCCGFQKEEQLIPLEDRQKALSLLTELALQRGTLDCILDCILLLLHLSDKASRSNELLKTEHDKEPFFPAEEELNYPLVPFLRRISNIPSSSGLYIPLQTDEACYSGDHPSPTKSFLDFVTLPNDDSTRLGLKQCATIALSHLDRLAEPYICSEETIDGTVKRKASEIAHWGSNRSEGGPSIIQTSNILLEIGAKEFYSSPKHRVVLTVHGTVFYVMDASMGDFTVEQLFFPGDEEIIQIDHNPSGNHILALTKDGKVYSWGQGSNGVLGIGNTESQTAPTAVAALSGDRIVHISAGSMHSAAVTEDGVLYTWGKGSYGRLGHGNAEDKLIPTIVEGLNGVKIVQVDCGSGDAHTLALDDTGQVWSWGDGDYGKLGRPGSDQNKVPKPISGIGSTSPVVKIICGNQISMALTKDGKLYSWGCGDTYQLGHGNQEHVRQPKLIEGLSETVVSDVSVGAQHCVALTTDSDVYAWGKNSSFEVNESGDIISSPLMIEAASGKGALLIACGASETFVSFSKSPTPTGKELPFILNVSTVTFEKLDQLLKIVCDKLDGKGPNTHPPSQEQECMAIAALNLLKLQLYTATSSGIPSESIGLQPGSTLLQSIKHFVIDLAGESGVIPSVQNAAQSVLRSGWAILLPTVSERASALSGLLPSGPVTDSLPKGQQFMIHLLVNSLMADHGLENALMSAITFETREQDTISEILSDDAVPLLHLVHQLIGNSISMSLSYFKQLLQTCDIKKPTVIDDSELKSDSSAKGLLQLFQRLLLSNVFSCSKTNEAQTRGALSVLIKYIAMVQEYSNQVLHSAIRVGSLGPRYFILASSALSKGMFGALLPELAVGLVLLQLKAPLLISESDCVPLLSGLLDLLDKFNRLSPNCTKLDEEDMAWPDVKNISFADASCRVVTKSDIEKHNSEEGEGKWLIIKGKVYDGEQLASQVSLLHVHNASIFVIPIILFMYMYTMYCTW